PINSLVPASRL
ncbi:hypothetical protein ECTW00353_1706, partial [Escherichia coli TW00353]